MWSAFEVMRKNKEFNELESLKYFNSFFVLRPIVNERGSCGSCVADHLTFQIDNLLSVWRICGMARLPSLVIKLFLWPFPLFSFSKLNKQQFEELELFQTVLQIIVKHRLMTTCAEEKKVLLISIKLRALKYVDDRDRLFVFGCVTKQMSERSVKVIKLLTFIRYRELNVNSELVRMSGEVKLNKAERHNLWEMNGLKMESIIWFHLRMFKRTKNLEQLQTAAFWVWMKNFVIKFRYFQRFGFA